MSWTPVVAVTATLPAILIVYVWHRYRRLRRVLAVERSRARLMEGAQYRNVRALKDRLDEARDQTAVIEAAEHELGQALARYRITDPTEGGSS